MAVTKVINSEEKQFRPVLVDKVVLDATPTVNSFNSVTSDGVARAIAGASGEVPVVTENDNGKVLKAVYDEGGPAVEWGEGVTVDQTYDATSANAQSGVAVAEAVGGVSAVPSVTSTDDGKVLKASYDSVAGTGSFSWETQTVPTVDQTYDASSTNAQSGTAVAGALAGVNQVPASTSTDANKVLTVDSQGVPGWATPAVPAGGDGIKAIYPQSVAGSSNDGSLRVLNCNAFGLKYPAEIFPFSFRILTYSSFSTDSIPMYGRYGDKMYMHGSRYISLATKYFGGMADGVYYAWFPCTGYITDVLTPISKDIYLKSKTKIVFTRSAISTYAYKTDGTRYTVTGSNELQFRESVKTPFSETPSLELYAEDFDLVGDWSTVSTLPKLEWVLGFMNPNGTWDSINGSTSDNNSALAASIPAGLSLALQPVGGLELNPVTGLKVLNPLPSSASTDEGKVLTVDSQGAAAWSTLPSDVPTYSDADSGKVLQVQADGTLAWVTLP